MSKTPRLTILLSLVSLVAFVAGLVGGLAGMIAVAHLRELPAELQQFRDSMDRRLAEGRGLSPEVRTRIRYFQAHPDFGHLSMRTSDHERRLADLEGEVFILSGGFASTSVEDLELRIDELEDEVRRLRLRSYW